MIKYKTPFYLLSMPLAHVESKHYLPYCLPELLDVVCLCLLENTRVALLSVSPLVSFTGRGFLWAHKYLEIFFLSITLLDWTWFHTELVSVVTVFPLGFYRSNWCLQTQPNRKQEPSVISFCFFAYWFLGGREACHLLTGDRSLSSFKVVIWGAKETKMEGDKEEVFLGWWDMWKACADWNEWLPFRSKQQCVAFTLLAVGSMATETKLFSSFYGSFFPP